MDKKKYTVLVLEDEDLLLSAISRKLEQYEINVLPCKGGKEGIEILSKLEKLPDAIWLDYYLKDMNGLEFMNALKQNDKWLNIPTFVVSNSASPEKVTHMLTLGVKKYYLKAENRLDDIIASVKNMIEEDKKTNPN